MTGDLGTGVKEMGDPCSALGHEEQRAEVVEDKANDEDKLSNPASAGTGDAAGRSVVEGEERGQQQIVSRMMKESGAGADEKSGDASGLRNEKQGGKISAEGGAVTAGSAAAETVSAPSSVLRTAKDGVGGFDAATEGIAIESQAILGRTASLKNELELEPDESKDGNESKERSDNETAANSNAPPDRRGGDAAAASTSASASVPPQVLSDAIVAAYERGFQLGLTASSTVPQSPVASSSSAAMTTATTAPSPYRAALIPSLVGSPMSLGGGGGGGGVGYHLSSPIGSSPYSVGGMMRTDRTGVMAFRMPPSRMEGAFLGHHEQIADKEAARHPYELHGDKAGAAKSEALREETSRGAIDEQKRAGGSVDGSSGSSLGNEDSMGGNTNDHDDDSNTAKKRERARARANNRKGYIEMIASKQGKKELTEYERNELKSWEERRDRKNNRSRERSMEKKSRIRHILDTPDNERSEEDAAFLREYQARRERKNEGDRLRRERIRKMAGCGPKPTGVTVPARGPIKLPTGEVVEREEDAAAALLAKKDTLSNDAASEQEGKTKPGRKIQRKRTSSEAALADGPKPNSPGARGEGRSVQLPPAFVPPVPSLSTQSAVPPHLLPTMYPHYGVPLAPKAPYYPGLSQHVVGGGGVAHPSLMAMNRIPFPPFYTGAPPHGPVPNWAASSVPALHQYQQGSHALGRAFPPHEAVRAADSAPAGTTQNRHSHNHNHRRSRLAADSNVADGQSR